MGKIVIGMAGAAVFGIITFIITRVILSEVIERGIVTPMEETVVEFIPFGVAAAVVIGIFIAAVSRR